MIRFLVLALVFATFAKPAFAYIDAALGGLILQTIVAGFFTFVMIWRGWVDKVKSFFNRNKQQEGQE